MRPVTRMLLIAALLLLPARPVLAQTGVDPSGHWEGPIQVPQMEVKIEIDLAKNSKGELVRIPAHHERRFRSKVNTDSD